MFNTPMPRRRFTQAAGAALGAGLLPDLALSQVAPPAGFWTLLREGGCVLLMRHAQTQGGGGDPPNFTLGDCSTQRNLSEAGREQARKMHTAFMREQVQIHQVRSSAWCRCADTAMLAFKKNTVWPPLNAFFGAEEREEQTLDVIENLRGWAAPRNQVLVTHHINVEALTGQTPAMGEILLTRPGKDSSGTQLRVLARHSF
ncbi:histidine phosphatase family protein [Hydrogenophaga palleronii]|uniref:histidine phosphatase family protein n=1 Tax=Hydrogenophaga palleronii TaxID=65655 RepID=UPI000A45ED6D|nr:histidine phosphatase family protein [Hydrogenophaga palleronii]